MDSNGTYVVVVVKGMEQPLKSCQSLHIQKEVPFMDWSVPGQYIQLGAEHKLPEMELCLLICSLFAPFIKRWDVSFRLGVMETKTLEI